MYMMCLIIHDQQFVNITDDITEIKLESVVAPTGFLPRK